MPGKLVYGALVSLDGYIEDSKGEFDWAQPDDEVHQFVNDFQRPMGSYLYGRRMYEVMKVWQTYGTESDPEPHRDFGELWRAADKIVFSTTLAEVATPRTRIVKTFDAGVIRNMKASASRDIGIGGSELAAQAFRERLIDEIQLVIAPVIVGGGKPPFPDSVRLNLDLLGERSFSSGFVHVHYRVRA